VRQVVTKDARKDGLELALSLEVVRKDALKEIGGT